MSGMTMAEKILSRTSGRDRVKPGDIVWANIDRTRGSGLVALEKLGITKVWDPDRIMVINEHFVPALNVAMADEQVELRRLVKKYGIKNFYDVGRHGNLHGFFVEKGWARPGELVAAHDSHTTTYGALNVAARSLNTEMFYIMATGRLWFRVPESMRFWITGKFQKGVYSKDLILHIAGKYGTDIGLYKSVEFVGPTIDEMSVDARQTITNLGIEISAKFAIMEANQQVIDYVKARTNEPFTPVKSDRDASFVAEYEVDVSQLGPQVACPHDVSNVKPIEQVVGTKINQAFVGACANGRYEDLVEAARVVKGHHAHPSVRFIVTPITIEVYKRALDTGVIETLSDAGAVVTVPTCGVCPGVDWGVLGDGEVAVHSTNRNFQARGGSTKAFVYLASPAVAAASAIAGHLADPRDYI